MALAGTNPVPAFVEFEPLLVVFCDYASKEISCHATLLGAPRGKKEINDDPPMFIHGEPLCLRMVTQQVTQKSADSDKSLFHYIS